MTSVRTCVIRADASPSIGGGHVMRCLTLADGLTATGWRCVFAVDAVTQATIPALAGRKVVELTGGLDPTSLMEAYPGGTDLLVTDHYGIDTAYEGACRGWAGHILAIDDLADRHHECDLLLDQTLGRTVEDYRPWVGPDTRLMLGPDYALLRPEFGRSREDSLAARQVRPPRRILVSAGLTDPFNVTIMLLDAISRIRCSLAVDVVIGSGCPHLVAIHEAAHNIGASVHVDCTDIARLMAAADLALGAPGATSWERCCLGLPSLLLILAENQRPNAAALESAGAAMVLGDRRSLDATAVACSLAEVLDDVRKLSQMSACAAAICDGRGLDRVGELLNGL